MILIWSCTAIALLLTMAGDRRSLCGLLTRMLLTVIALLSHARAMAQLWLATVDRGFVGPLRCRMERVTSMLAL